MTQIQFFLLHLAFLVEIFGTVKILAQILLTHLPRNYPRPGRSYGVKREQEPVHRHLPDALHCSRRTPTVYKKTEEYADEAYKAAVKGGIFTAIGIGTGVGMVAISPSEWKDLTTTFGRDNTDKVINTFSSLEKGGNVEKARFGKIQSLLTKHLGKIGLGVTATSLALGIAYVSWKNYNISNQLVTSTLEKGEKVAHLRKKKNEIEHLYNKTDSIKKDLKKNLYRLKGLSERYGDYGGLNKKSKDFLLSYINNTFSLAVLLNKDIK